MKAKRSSSEQAPERAAGAANKSGKAELVKNKSAAKPEKVATNKKKATTTSSKKQDTDPKVGAKKTSAKPSAKLSTKSSAKPSNKPSAESSAKPAAKPAAKTSAKVSLQNKASKSASTKKAPESTKAKAGKTPGLASKQEAAEMMSMLCQLYPDADCELTYKNDFELLTAVILSAQTTDVQVNKVTPGLFAKFPNARALASANPEDVKNLIKATGYYNNKAKSIQSCATAIVEKFNSKVPATLEELITLPGVGRKTANVLLGVIHKVPGWTVDTHVQRLSQRLGFTKNTDPAKIEIDLQKLFPEQDWTQYSITIIWHGRRLCFARNPDCIACPLNHICPSSLAP